MGDIPDELVTVAVLSDSPTANLVKNRLQAAGIRAYLEGEETLVAASFISGLSGGAKVQVAARDAEDALAVLRKKETPYDEDPSAFSTPAALRPLSAENLA